MQNITIGRYDHDTITRAYTGWIEGKRSDGTGWIMFLDETGAPSQFYPYRDATGAVQGAPVNLN